MSIYTSTFLFSETLKHSQRFIFFPLLSNRKRGDNFQNPVNFLMLYKQIRGLKIWIFNYVNYTHSLSHTYFYLILLKSENHQQLTLTLLLRTQSLQERREVQRYNMILKPKHTNSILLKGAGGVPLRWWSSGYHKSSGRWSTFLLCSTASIWRSLELGIYHKHRLGEQC